MPTLSFVLSGLLVSAGMIYSYLSYSQKIEESKVKIEESKKLMYIAKKNSLNTASVSNYDINNTSLNISLDEGMISTYIAKDETLNKKETKLLDKLQLAMQEVVLKTDNENPDCGTLAATGYISISECISLKNKELKTYKVTSDEVKIPDNSILAKDSKIQIEIVKNIESAKNSDLLAKKNIDSFHKEIENSKVVEKVVTTINDTQYFEKIATKYISKDKSIATDNLVKTFEKASTRFATTDTSNDTSKLNKIISQYKEKKSKSDEEYKKKISFLEEQKYKLIKEKNTLNESIKKLTKDLEENSKTEHNSMFSMFKDTTKSMINNLKSDLDEKRYQLKKVDQKIDEIDKQIAKLNPKQQG